MRLGLQFFLDIFLGVPLRIVALQAFMNSSRQVLFVETGFTVRYVMVKIVEAATTISPALRPRSLIIAMVIIGSMFFFLS